MNRHHYVYIIHTFENFIHFIKKVTLFFKINNQVVYINQSLQDFASFVTIKFKVKLNMHIEKIHHDNNQNFKLIARDVTNEETHNSKVIYKLYIAHDNNKIVMAKTFP